MRTRTSSWTALEIYKKRFENYDDKQNYLEGDVDKDRRNRRTMNHQNKSHDDLEMSQNLMKLHLTRDLIQK